MGFYRQTLAVSKIFSCSFEDYLKDYESPHAIWTCTLNRSGGLTHLYLVAHEDKAAQTLDCHCQL